MQQVNSNNNNKQVSGTVMIIATQVERNNKKENTSKIMYSYEILKTIPTLNLLEL